MKRIPQNNDDGTSDSNAILIYFYFHYIQKSAGTMQCLYDDHFYFFAVFVSDLIGHLSVSFWLQ